MPLLSSRISQNMLKGEARPREAAIYATNEVWLAVIVTTLTVVAVFFPLTFVKGLTGVLFKQLGMLVSITIVTSVFAAITLTPTMSALLLKWYPIRKDAPIWSLMTEASGKGLTGLMIFMRRPFAGPSS